MERELSVSCLGKSRLEASIGEQRCREPGCMTADREVGAPGSVPQIGGWIIAVQSDRVRPSSPVNPKPLPTGSAGMGPGELDPLSVSLP